MAGLLIKNKMLLIIISCLLCVGCQSIAESANLRGKSNISELTQPENATFENLAAEEIKVKNFSLKLENCELFYEGEGKSGRVKLNLPAECSFIKNSQGKLQPVETKYGAALAVGSSRPLGAGSRDCETVVRVIIVREGAVEFSNVENRTANCSLGVDEKVLSAFSTIGIDAANAEKGQIINKLRVKDYALNLEDCIIKYEGAGKSESFTFDLPKPCRFADNGKISPVRAVLLKDDGFGLLVHGDEENAESNGNENGKRACKFRGRFVFVKKNGVFLSAKSVQEKNRCPADLSEKDYQKYAAQTVSFKQAAKQKP